jgi:hypothetical protein
MSGNRLSSSSFSADLRAGVQAGDEFCFAVMIARDLDFQKGDNGSPFRRKRASVSDEHTTEISLFNLPEE